MRIIMIGTIRNGKYIKGFRLVDADSGQVMDVGKEDLVNKIRSEVVSIENLGINSENEIECTCGKMSDYGEISIYNFNIIKQSLTVLTQITPSVYKVCDTSGRIDHMEIQSILEIMQSVKLGNAIIDKAGDEETITLRGKNHDIPLDKLAVSKQYGRKLMLKNQIAVVPYLLDERYFAYLDKNSKDERVFIGKGCLGLKESGFYKADWIKEFILPETLEIIEPKACMGIGVEKLVIPEGVSRLTYLCIANCSNLKELHLPNSMKVIERAALQGNNKLKTIYTGQNKIDIAMGALPSGVKRVIRK